MGKKISYLVLSSVLMIIIMSAAAQGAPDPFIKGSLFLEMEKEEYLAGESIALSLTAENLNSFPIIDGYIVVELVEGPSSPAYPAHTSNEDNIIDGIVMTNISILPGEKREMTYELSLPADINPGNYRIDAFFKTPRTPIVGIPFIFIPGRSSEFTVINSGLSSSAKILRTETEFAGEKGQTGPSVYSEDILTGTVYIENDGDTELNGLALDVSLHRWDDTENGPDASITKNVPSLLPGEKKAIAIEIDIPDNIPKTAYSIKVKLYGERTFSFYRSRINLIGEGCRIGKLIPDKASYEKGDEGFAEILLIGPSDKMSSLEGAYLDFSIESEGKAVFTAKEDIGVLNVDNPGQSLSIAFPVKSDLNDYTIACAVVKEGEVLDEYSVHIYPGKFSSERIESSAEFVGNSSLRVCLLDCFGRSAESEITVFLSYPDGNTKVVANNLAVSGCTDLDIIGAVPGKYSVRILGSDLDRTHELEIKEAGSRFSFPGTSPDDSYDILAILAAAAVIIAASTIIIRRHRRKKMIPLIPKEGEGKGLLGAM